MSKKLSAAEETRQKNAAAGQSSKDELARARQTAHGRDERPGDAPARKLVEMIAGKRRPPAGKRDCDG